jgi:cytochrome c biogenesis protein CcdA
MTDRVSRNLAAGTAMLVALAIAFGGALVSRGGDSGPALLVTTASVNAADALGGLGDALPIGYAFAAGLAAAVNPCGFALLPAYLGLYLGSTSGVSGHPIGRALAVGLTMTASFVTLFALVGLVLAATAASLVAVLPWANLVIGILLVVVAGRLLAGRSLDAGPFERLGARLGPLAARSGLIGYAAYGAAFALTSLGCTLPLFLSVVGTALVAGGVGAGLIQFALYGFGMGLVVTTATVLVALFGRALLMRVRAAGRWLEPAGAVLLLVTGTYVVYYWLTVGGLLA